MASKPGPRRSRRRGALLLKALLLASSGCGPVSYNLEVGKAERAVETARAENAGYHAPYELAYAEAQLAKAHEEAAQGQYEDALHALGDALAYARRALNRSAQPGAPDR
jgi:hypothetical protein